MLEAHKYHCSVRVLYPTRLCLQCACDSLKKKLYFSVHCCFSGVHSCEIIVKRPSVRVASRKKKKITNGTKQPSYREIKRTCVDFFFFLPALAKGWWPLNNLNLCEYSK